MDILEKYAAKGGQSLLVQVSNYFRCKSLEQVRVTVDHNVAVALLPRLFSEIEIGGNGHTWAILSCLLGKKANTGADELLDAFQATPFTRCLLDISVDLRQNAEALTHEDFITKVLACFVIDRPCGERSAVRRRMAGDTRGLAVQAIRLAEMKVQSVSGLSSSFFAISFLCGLAAARVDGSEGPADERDMYAEAFLRARGLDALIKVFQFAVENDAAVIGGVDIIYPCLVSSAHTIKSLMVFFKEPITNSAGDY